MQQIIKNQNTHSDTPIPCNPDRWIKEHQSYLLAYAIKRMQDKEAAQDLVQESFLAALEHIGNFQFRCSERTWLMAILKNKIIDHYRKQEKEHRNTSDLKYFRPAYELPSEQEDFFLLLGRAMQKLPALWQAVFTMKHLEDEPAEEICRKLEITPSNYWVISHRTRLNLRACLRNHL